MDAAVRDVAEAAGFLGLMPGALTDRVPEIGPLGDSGVIAAVSPDDEQAVRRLRALIRLLESSPPDWMLEYVASFATVALFYDPVAVVRRYRDVVADAEVMRGEASKTTNGGAVQAETVQSVADAQTMRGLTANTTNGEAVQTKGLKSIAKADDELAEGAGGALRVLRADVLALWDRCSTADDRSTALVEIPVCYGGDLGPDLADLAAGKSMPEAEWIGLHAEAEYTVDMIGFVPGFPYLSGLPEQLAVPRRATPRLSVPAGSVAIAGRQTGIYPMEVPGGWHLVGRTPFRLFDGGRRPPALLQAGDRVRFVAISDEAYKEMVEGTS